MTIDIFNKRKKDILSKLDKSHKSSWDAKISELCNRINLLDNYYTTSSCSGRIIVMIEQEKKAENLFISVYHDKITFKKLKDELNKLIFNPPAITPTAHPYKAIKFKVEPCILHVACRTLEDAEKMNEKAKLAGWKKSGIIGVKNAFTAELNGTERLEFPIIQKNRILVDDEFLKIVVAESNSKLEKSEERIRKLERLIK